MDEYFLYLIDNFSLEIFLMSLAVFALTMLIKIPIKKATSNLEEVKRQGINSLIIFIPLVLSFIVCLVYFLITSKKILSLDYLSCSLSMCILSITIYHIYTRLIIIAKGVFSGKIKTEDIKEAVKDISEVLENGKVSSGLTIKEKLEEIKNKLNALNSFKTELENQGGAQNITAINEASKEIELLKEEQELLTKKL